MISPMTIVTYVHRPKRARKRKQKQPVAIPTRIVSARKPEPAAPAIAEAVTERRRPAQAAVITNRIVTAPRRSSRFGPVQDLDEEHQRRRDAAVAMFKELVRRGNG
jgi:hypothetical protein